MVEESNQSVFSIQIDASSFAEFELSEFEISEFEISRVECTSVQHSRGDLCPKTLCTVSPDLSGQSLKKPCAP